MADGLVIKVGADVGEAVSGLGKVDQAVNKTSQSLSKLPGATGQATMSITNLSRVVQDAPYGFIGIANNINPLVESFGRLKAETGSTKGALSALLGGLTGPGGLGLAFAAVTTAITFAQIGFSAWTRSTSKGLKEAKSDADKLKDSINGIFTETAKEASSAAGFVAILKSETETRQRKLEAIKELQKIQPEIFAGLKLEGNAVANLDSAYQSYLSNLKNVIAAKIKQAQLEQLLERQLKLEGKTLVGNEKTLAEGNKRLQELRANDPRLQGGDKAAIQGYYKAQEDASKKAAQSLQSDIEQITKDLQELSQGIKTSPLSTAKIKIEKPKQVNLSELFNTELELPTTFSDEVKSEGFNLGNMYGDIFARAAEHKLTGIDFTMVEANANKLLEAQAVLYKLGQDTAKAFNDGFKNLATEGLTSVGETIGGLFGGGDIKNAFQAFANIIGSGLAAIGKQLVAIGVAALLAKDALKSLFKNPVLAIGAGIALIAAGTAMKTALSGGLPGRATGGPVSGNSPYMVGERGPELFVPSVSGTIIPNNRIGAMGGRPVNAGGGSTRTVIRGQDIILSYARTSRSQSRVNG